MAPKGVAQLLIERVQLIGAVSGILRIDHQDSAIRRLEAQIPMLQPMEAHHEKACAAEQNHTNCNLRGDEDLLRPQGAVTGRTICSAQRLNRVGVRSQPGRQPRQTAIQ